MTIEQLLQLAPHLPAGTRVNLSFEIQGGGGPSQASSPATETPDADTSDTVEGVIVDDQGIAWLKVPAASEFSGLPEREIKRATKRGYLEVDVKRDGRDAGAHLVSIPDLERYKDRRDAIEAFREDPPADWPGPGREG